MFSVVNVELFFNRFSGGRYQHNLSGCEDTAKVLVPLSIVLCWMFFLCVNLKVCLFELGLHHRMLLRKGVFG